MVLGGMREVILTLQKNPKYKDVVNDLPAPLQIIYKLDSEDPKFQAKANEIVRKNRIKMIFDPEDERDSGKDTEKGGDHE